MMVCSLLVEHESLVGVNTVDVTASACRCSADILVDTVARCNDVLVGIVGCT